MAATGPGADDARRQLEEASEAIEARVREIEASGGPELLDVRSATDPHWTQVPNRVQVSYERRVAPPATASDRPSDTCLVCGRDYQLKKDGTLRKHWARDGQGKGLPFSDPCLGSGQPPKEQP